MGEGDERPHPVGALLPPSPRAGSAFFSRPVSLKRYSPEAGLANDHPERLDNMGVETTSIRSMGIEANSIRSPGAERMARHRDRRRKGLRCVTILLRETEIDALIRRGRLYRDDRVNPAAVRRALYGFLDDHLR